MGKTKSIKERRVDVYLDTLERKERWTEFAEEADESLSKFVQKCVEYAIEQGGPDFAELGERSKKIIELEESVNELQKDIKQKDIVIEKLETDLKRLRMEPFLEEGFEGKREYDSELIEVLQNADQVTSEEIIRQLSVEPNDADIMAGISNQLQQLESYGLVRSTSQGWEWTG